MDEDVNDGIASRNSLSKTTGGIFRVRDIRPRVGLSLEYPNPRMKFDLDERATSLPSRPLWLQNIPSTYSSLAGDRRAMTQNTRSTVRRASRGAAFRGKSIPDNSGGDPPQAPEGTHHVSTQGRFFSVLTGLGGIAIKPPMIQRLVSAGSITSSISNSDAVLTALPLA
jgi:hypothetical protein